MNKDLGFDTRALVIDLADLGEVELAPEDDATDPELFPEPHLWPVRVVGLG